jgi:hypothetical protein
MNKQETLEEAAENYGWRIKTNSFSDRVKANELAESSKQDFIEGAKWQAEKMYSEEDMINFHKWAYQKNRIEESDKTTKELLKEWFEQFKKK